MSTVVWVRNVGIAAAVAALWIGGCATGGANLADDDDDDDAGGAGGQVNVHCPLLVPAGTTCAICADEHCSAACESCATNPACVSLLECMLNCADYDCAKSCIAQYPGGLQQVTSLADCVDASCSLECGDIVPDTSNPCGSDCSEIVTDDCHEAICNEQTGSCAVVDAAAGTPCDDGEFCTISEVCTAGVCGGGVPNDCEMTPPPCSEVICQEASESCTSVPAGDGTYCQADDLCQVNAQCLNGLCVGTPKDCSYAPKPDPQECYIAECNPQNGQCEPEPGNDADPCTDLQDPCTVNKICDDGACVAGEPMDCSNLTVGCFNGLCDPASGTCFQDPVSEGGYCAEATDSCHQGICDVNGQCVGQPANLGGACEDGDPCTSGETCDAQGACLGGQPVQQVIYFEEDFADNSAGWQLDTEWQIGPAQASYGGTGTGDPSTDHTPTADNGVAGVVIGGNASTPIHPFYYLTSPVVDTSGAPGSLWLGLYRWLNSDYTPYMQNHVQVYNGSTWVTLWESGPYPAIFDSSWYEMTFDITQYKNPNMRMRIGFNIDSTGVYTVGQWNVDDVVIANVICGS